MACQGVGGVGARKIFLSNFDYLTRDSHEFTRKTSATQGLAIIANRPSGSGQGIAQGKEPPAPALTTDRLQARLQPGQQTTAQPVADIIDGFDPLYNHSFQVSLTVRTGLPGQDSSITRDINDYLGQSLKIQLHKTGQLTALVSETSPPLIGHLRITNSRLPIMYAPAAVFDQAIVRLKGNRLQLVTAGSVEAKTLVARLTRGDKYYQKVELKMKLVPRSAPADSAAA